MLIIYDNDLPITAAAKIITATKEPEIKNENGAIVAAAAGADMFTDEELKEIAMYLLTYCEVHKQSSTN